MRDTASITFCLNAPPIVLTPMIVVGLMLSIAATKSRVGACLWHRVFGNRPDQCALTRANR
jgi:hypothetical protein